MRKKIHSHHRPLRKKIPFLGILLILTGVLFIGINVGLLPPNFGHILISWQMLIILFGIAHLFGKKFLSASFFIFVGMFFIVPRVAEVFPEQLSCIPDNFLSLYWPVLLVATGILILLHRIVIPHKHHKFCMPNHESPFSHQKFHRKGKSGFEKKAVFGDVKHIILDPVFTSGEVNAVFGGITLDLRKTSLPEGETILDVNAVFGGVIIFVPEDWYVESRVDSVFGGFKDSRIPPSEESIDKSRKLIITGSCVFGGGELDN